MSLCYQPAANRITVVILKARNIPKMDITGLSGNDIKSEMCIHKRRKSIDTALPITQYLLNFVILDPYVKIYLLYNDQRIAKKKTHVKKRTLNPVFNESFVFELPHLEEGLKNISLEFMLLDWDRVTKNEVKTVNLKSVYMIKIFIVALYFRHINSNLNIRAKFK